jgi:hypothetical protein
VQQVVEADRPEREDRDDRGDRDRDAASVGRHRL